MSPKPSNAAARTRLNRADLVQRALELADEHGLEALTIRRLAEEFAVTPMAMYWHFAAKGDLLAAIGDRIIDDVETPDSSLGLEKFLTTALANLVDALREHPAVAELAPARILHSDRGRELTERALAVLADAGFDVDRAAGIAHNALQSAVMLVSGEPGRENGTKPEEREAVLREKRATLLSLPTDRYPHLVAAAEALTTCDDSDTYYRTSIETFVAGVVALRPR